MLNNSCAPQTLEQMTSDFLDVMYEENPFSLYARKMQVSLENCLSKIYSTQTLACFQQLEEQGLPRTYLDSIAIEYARNTPNTRILTMYPNAQGHDDAIKKIISRYGKLVYTKPVMLNRRGVFNIMRAFYRHHMWIGRRENRYLGLMKDTKRRHKKNSPTRVYLVEIDNDDISRQVKEEIRQIFGGGKSSVHINDLYAETVEFARMFFNENSIHFLNHCELNNDKYLHECFEHYRKHILAHGVDHFSLVNGAVKAFYGRGKTKTLQYICRDNVPKLNAVEGIEYVSGTEEQQANLYNPEAYFFYDDVKFLI